MEKDAWSVAVRNLKSGQRIRNWTPYSGYMGDDIIIDRVDSNCIQISAPNSHSKNTTYIILYKHEIGDFARIWRMVKDRKINRAEYVYGDILGKSTRRKTRYCLDIFQELSNKNLI